MVSDKNISTGIPVSPELSQSLIANDVADNARYDKKRILLISFFAIITAMVTSVVAKLLVYLIDFFTSVSFFGHLSLSNTSPADNTLGLFVIVIPAIGGIIVGLMAYYGSEAIRGHGIPEAMEQILTNQSKIHPSITYLKPLSSAISIGTGGPFGAEGPIIATGGALGSTLGQLVKITHNERKILLAAGATAGMAAIFGSPLAGIFLAIELLLFEFSPRSIIPVALACITGAAGHHFFFHAGPVFPMADLQTPGNTALGLYIAIGFAMGIIATLVTKAVYYIEDGFEKLPVHWMWWPAIGGLAVGIIGYFAPYTMGVGYENITHVLSGTLALKVVLFLSVLKFLSWAIALGSGTSGGTLAPLLTIGGATGALLGMGVIYVFPEAGVILPMAALVGMSAMFAGASRAVLTSIVFALETTGQSHALLPLIGGCMASYIVSYLLMENTIMTEKIARRGVKTPHSYEPDILEKVTVETVMQGDSLTISEDTNIAGVREWLGSHKHSVRNYFVIVNDEGAYKGIVSFVQLFDEQVAVDTPVKLFIKHHHATVVGGSSLRTAAEIMARENIDLLPVVSNERGHRVVGVLSFKDIISAYKLKTSDHLKGAPHISLKRQGIKVLIKGQKLITLFKMG